MRKGCSGSPWALEGGGAVLLLNPLAALVHPAAVVSKCLVVSMGLRKASSPLRFLAFEVGRGSVMVFIICRKWLEKNVCFWAHEVLRPEAPRFGCL